MSIRTNIAGVFACPLAKEPMKAMLEGDAYQWKAEPENQYDPNAIAIYIGETKAGFIPRKIASEIKADDIDAIKKTGQWDGIEIFLKGEDQ